MKSKHVSIEISCISSQQTLPVGRKLESASTAFMSDSDSSAGNNSHRRHPTPAHKTHQSTGQFFTSLTNLYPTLISTMKFICTTEDTTYKLGEKLTYFIYVLLLAFIDDFFVLIFTI